MNQPPTSPPPDDPYTLIPVELPFSEGGLKSLSASPRAVFEIIRLALMRIGEYRHPDDDTDESPEWIRARDSARKLAIIWMIRGFMQVLRRSMEARNLGANLAVRGIPDIDPRSFRAVFGLPEKVDFKADQQFLISNLGSLIQRMGDFADEFEVMSADWSTSLTSDGFIPRCWRAGMEAPWQGLKKTPVSVFRPEDIRIFGPGVSVAGATTAPIMPAQQVVSPTAPPNADRAELEALQERLERAEQEVHALRGDLQHERSDGVSAQYRDLVRTLRGRLQVLESLPRSSSSEVETETLPTQWDALPGFAASRLGGRVVITRRAYRAVRASVFRDVSFAFDVLRMLADDYVPMRHGLEGARERFEASCKRLRVRVSNTGEAVDAHRTSELYRVNHLGKRLPLDMHVAGNSSRDPREGFRLYFHYFEAPGEPGTVIVGHLPSHLDSTLT